MRTNAFIDKPTKPSDAQLATVLGPSKELWDRLLVELAEEYDVKVKEWKSYSRKSGWTLRLLRKKRAIVYLSPCDEGFYASFALGDRAVQAALKCRLPKRVICIIEQATRYVEGTQVQLDVIKPKDVDVVKQLAAIKIDN